MLLLICGKLKKKCQSSEYTVQSVQRYTQIVIVNSHDKSNCANWYLLDLIIMAKQQSSYGTNVFRINI